MKQLTTWRRLGNRLIVCIDMNEDQKQRKSEAGGEKVWHSQSAEVVAAGDQGSLEGVQEQVQLLSQKWSPIQEETLE